MSRREDVPQNIDLDGSTLKHAVAQLQETFRNIPEKYQHTARLEVEIEDEYDYGGEVVAYHVYYIREDTPEEIAFQGAASLINKKKRLAVLKTEAARLKKLIDIEEGAG